MTEHTTNDAHDAHDPDPEAATSDDAARADGGEAETALPDGGDAESYDAERAVAGAAPRSEGGDAKALRGPHPNERPEPRGKRNEQGIRIDPEAEAEHGPERVTLSAYVLHEPGVLAQVSSLFSRRQFNIESLTVGPTQEPERARITLVIEEPRPGIEQAKKQLAKLVDVVAVRELEPDATLRELALIKVDADHPDQVQSMAEMYGGQAVHAGPETVTVEITGSRPTVEDAVEAFQRFDVREVTRTGTAALERGTQRTAPDDEPSNAPMNDD